MQMSFLRRETVSYPLSKGLSRLYLGEVEVREFEKKIKEQQRPGESSFLWKTVLSTEPCDGPEIRCSTYSGGSLGDWGARRREARSENTEAFHGP